jgi:hypothetical protein
MKSAGVFYVFMKEETGKLKITRRVKESWNVYGFKTLEEMQFQSMATIYRAFINDIVFILDSLRFKI